MLGRLTSQCPYYRDVDYGSARCRLSVSSFRVLNVNVLNILHIRVSFQSVDLPQKSSICDYLVTAWPDCLQAIASNTIDNIESHNVHNADSVSIIFDNSVMFRDDNLILDLDERYVSNTRISVQVCVLGRCTYSFAGQNDIHMH